MRTVLLVDGDDAFTFAVEKELTRAGLHGVPLHDGARAVDRARAEKPDLVVMAVELRELSGFSLCNRLRRTPGLAEVPAILLAEEATEEAIAAHRAAPGHADLYLRKPIAPAELVREVIKVLERPKPAPPALDLDIAGMAEAALSVASAADQIHAIPFPDAELAAEPRAPLGASPDEKVQFLRERLKAREEILNRARATWEEREEAVRAVERKMASLESALALARKNQAELAARVEELSPWQERARVAAERIVGLERELAESKAASAQMLHRADSLSEILNETLGKRELEERASGQKLADAERRASQLALEIEALGRAHRMQAEEVAAAQARIFDQSATLESARVEGQESEEKLEQVSEELTRMRAEREALAGEATALDEKLRAAADRAAGLDKEHAEALGRAQRALAEAEGRFGAQMERAENAEAEMRLAVDRASDLEERVAKALRQAEDAARETDAAGKARTAAMAASSEAGRRVAQLEEDLARAASSLEASVKFAERSASLERELERLQGKLSTAEAVAAEAEGRARDAAPRLAALEAERAETLQRSDALLAGLRKELEDSRARDAAALAAAALRENTLAVATEQSRAQAETAHHDAEQALQELARSNQEAGRLREALAAAESRAAKVAGGAGASASELLAAQREVVALRQRVSELENEAAEAGAQAATRAAEDAEARAAAEEKAQAAVGIAEAMAAEVQQLRAEQARGAGARDAARDVARQLAEARASNEALGKERQALRAEVGRLGAETQRLQASLAGAPADKDRLVQQITQLAARIAERDAEIEDLRGENEFLAAEIARSGTGVGS